MTKWYLPVPACLLNMEGKKCFFIEFIVCVHLTDDHFSVVVIFFSDRILASCECFAWDINCKYCVLFLIDFWVGDFSFKLMACFCNFLIELELMHLAESYMSDVEKKFFGIIQL